MSELVNVAPGIDIVVTRWYRAARAVAEKARKNARTRTNGAHRTRFRLTGNTSSFHLLGTEVPYTPTQPLGQIPLSFAWIGMKTSLFVGSTATLVSAPGSVGMFSIHWLVAASMTP